MMTADGKALGRSDRRRAFHGNAVITRFDSGQSLW